MWTPTPKHEKTGMGAKTEYYEQQSVEVLTPEIHVIATGDDPLLLWTAGVIVPLILGILGFWFNQRRKQLTREDKGAGK